MVILVDSETSDGACAILRHGDPEYESARRTALRVGTPDVVLRPKNATGVRAAIRFARDRGLPVAVRGGGHSFAGFGTLRGGAVIDLTELDTVDVLDDAHGIVRVGGGATWGQVARELDAHGLALSSGDTASVGVGGLTLTGGIGWKVRRHGLTLDSLIAAELITASGRELRASASENADLFWALRGGGGNFGIVSAFHFKAHRTAQVHFGTITFPSRELQRVLTGWARYMRSAPEELTSVLNVANPVTGGPDAPVEVWVCVDSDDTDRANRTLRPIRALGSVTSDDVKCCGYSATLQDGGQLPPDVRLVTRDGFVPADSVGGALETVALAAAAPGSPFISIRSLGGAVSAVDSRDTAFAHREAELLVVTITAGSQAAIDAKSPDLDVFWSKLDRHLHGAYANFLTSATPADVAAVYPPATLRRLRETKAEYDPLNVFSSNLNIAPSSRITDTDEPADG